MTQQQIFNRRTVRRGGRWLLLLFSLFGLLFIANSYFEPFSPRYEGRTVREWILSSARRHAEPDWSAVRHFGSVAVPVLLRESEPGPLYSATVLIEAKLGMRRFDRVRSFDFDRRMACAEWARMLLEHQPGVVSDLLGAAPSDEYALRLTRLFYGERDLAAALRSFSRQTTNVTLHNRAHELLKKRRGDAG
jgi:hypothetical protein